MLHRLKVRAESFDTWANRVKEALENEGGVKKGQGATTFFLLCFCNTCNAHGTKRDTDGVMGSSRYTAFLSHARVTVYVRFLSFDPTAVLLLA